VGIPDVVRLAHAVPEAFGSRLPLSVREAADAVKDTWFEAALAASAAERRNATGQPPAHHNGTAVSVSSEAGGGPAADPPVLSWDGVSVEFDGKRAVDDVTLAVHDGKWVAVIGANGSGKSTLTGLTVGLGSRAPVSKPATRAGAGICAAASAGRGGPCSPRPGR